MNVGISECFYLTRVEPSYKQGSCIKPRLKQDL